MINNISVFFGYCHDFLSLEFSVFYYNAAGVCMAFTMAKSFSLNLKYLFMCIFRHTHVGVHMPQHISGGQRQLTGIGSLLLSCRSQGLNSGLHDWWRVSLPTKSFLLVLLQYFYTIYFLSFLNRILIIYCLMNLVEFPICPSFFPLDNRISFNPYSVR